MLHKTTSWTPRGADNEAGTCQHQSDNSNNVLYGDSNKHNGAKARAEDGPASSWVFKRSSLGAGLWDFQEVELSGDTVILRVESQVNESKEARMCEDRVGKTAERQGPWACASKHWETALHPGRRCLDHLVTTLAWIFSCACWPPHGVWSEEWMLVCVRGRLIREKLKMEKAWRWRNQPGSRGTPPDMMQYDPEHCL